MVEPPNGGVPAGSVRASASKKRRDRWFFWGAIAVALAVPIALVVVPIYNKSRTAGIECTVTSAEGELDSVSARGFGLMVERHRPYI